MEYNTFKKSLSGWWNDLKNGNPKNFLSAICFAIFILAIFGISVYKFFYKKNDAVENEVKTYTPEVRFATQSIENSPGSTNIQNIQTVVYPKDQPRVLSQEIKDDILSQFKSNRIDKDKKIQVAAISGDGEAYNYAFQIMSFLKNEGYEVSGVDADLNPAPSLRVGVYLYLVPNTKNLYEIYVGSKS